MYMYKNKKAVLLMENCGNLLDAIPKITYGDQEP